jgi:hypothetical protein
MNPFLVMRGHDARDDSIALPCARKIATDLLPNPERATANTVREPTIVLHCPDALARLPDPRNTRSTDRPPKCP